MTAQETVTRIEEHFGSAWKNSGNDGFKAGNPSTPVTGIATAWTPSMDVLQKAVKAKQNLIITAEAPFWAGQGAGGAGRAAGRGTAPATKQKKGGGAAPAASAGVGDAGLGDVAGGPLPPTLRAENTDLYQVKQKYIADHGLVLWRFNENWLSLPNQPRLRALATTLKWSQHQDAAATEQIAAIGGAVYALPSAKLSALVSGMKAQLSARAMRVTGDPNAAVSRVVLRPGYLRSPEAFQLVRSTKADVVVCGEACEWEAFPYLCDWIAAGWGKAFIMTGLAVGERPAAQEMAAWIKSLVPNVPVTAVPSEEPFAQA